MSILKLQIQARLSLVRIARYLSIGIELSSRLSVRVLLHLRLILVRIAKYLSTGKELSSRLSVRVLLHLRLSLVRVWTGELGNLNTYLLGKSYPQGFRFMSCDT